MLEIIYYLVVIIILGAATFMLAGSLKTKNSKLAQHTLEFINLYTYFFVFASLIEVVRLLGLGDFLLSHTLFFVVALLVMVGFTITLWNNINPTHYAENAEFSFTVKYLLLNNYIILLTTAAFFSFLYSLFGD